MKNLVLVITSAFYKKIIGDLKMVSVHLIEKWRHFVSPKTLLCFGVRVWVEARG